MANWSELADDLLTLIVKRVTSYEEFITFRCVCRSWKSAATAENYNNRGFHQVPWLLLPEEEHNHEDDDDMLRLFFILSKRKLHEVMLPEASQKWCLSSLGWILTVAKDEVTVQLLHPLSRARIELPKLNTLKGYQYLISYKNVHYVSKFLLTASPGLSSDYVVMVLQGCLRRLGFCRQSDDRWTTVDTWDAEIFDITYYNGNLYAVDCLGEVLVCDVNDPNPTWDVAISLNGVFRCKERFYIVELSGKLVVVSREGAKDHKTTGFQAFELDLEDGKWVEVKDLGSKAMFLGYNSSFSVDGCEKMNGCKGNCIYFTDHSSECPERGGYQDMGIYNMFDGRIDALFNGKSCSRITGIWVEPSF